MQFVFTHNGRNVESDQTPEEAGMEDGDEILAVEMMDLTDGSDSDEWVCDKPTLYLVSTLTTSPGRTG
jgi:hypothetical protein